MIHLFASTWVKTVLENRRILQRYLSRYQKNDLLPEGPKYLQRLLSRQHKQEGICWFSGDRVLCCGIYLIVMFAARKSR